VNCITTPPYRKLLPASPIQYNPQSHAPYSAPISQPLTKTSSCSPLPSLHPLVYPSFFLSSPSPKLVVTTRSCWQAGLVPNKCNSPHTSIPTRLPSNVPPPPVLIAQTPTSSANTHNPLKPHICKIFIKALRPGSQTAQLENSTFHAILLSSKFNITPTVRTRIQLPKYVVVTGQKDIEIIIYNHAVLGKVPGGGSRSQFDL
jgi:hypothetical protein